MPTTFNGLTYMEGRDCETSVELSGGDARRTVFCDYEQAQQLCQFFTGGLTYAGGANFFYKAPEPHPRNGNLACTKATYIGYGPLGDNGAGVATFPKAKITLTYGVLTPQQRQNQQNYATQVIVTDRREISASVMAPRNSFKTGPKIRWNGGGGTPGNGEVINEHPGFVVPEMTWYIQLFGYSGPNVTNGNWDLAMGKINSGTFTKLNKTCTEKTLMFQGASPERSLLLDTLGNVILQAWNVTLQFSYRRQGWHKLMGPDGQFYEVVKHPGGGDVYTATSFDSLFDF